MLCALATFFVAAGTQGSDYLPDTPKNHWVYEARALLKAEGIFVGFGTEDRPLQKADSRHGEGLFFVRAATRMLGLLLSVTALRDQFATESANAPDAAHLAAEIDVVRTPEWSKCIAYLVRAQKEFPDEFRAAGLSADSMIGMQASFRRLLNQPQVIERGSALRQFSDVPTGHWAAKAVLELRSQGVLHGNPDGTFKGG